MGGKRKSHRCLLLALLTCSGLTALTFLGGCASFYPPVSDEEIQARFSTPWSLESKTVRIRDRSFHYVDTNGEGKPLVVFIHGAPGAWDAFADYLKNPRLSDRARLISVDRPGYGRSDLGRPERSLAVQAEVISHVFKHNQQGQGAIVVGHSFGGPIAAQLAIDYPDQVAAIVLVAPSVDPDLEKTKWYQIPAHWKLFSWMVPRDLYSTNEEILPLARELRILESKWDRIKVPVVVLQGEKDTLVPKENADFLERVLNQEISSIRRYRELSHFIPWSAPGLIIEAVLELLPSDKGEPKTKVD